jgi:Zn-dependent protease with chaperone function
MIPAEHRHPDESSWNIVSCVAGGATWAALVLFTFGIGLLIAIPIVFLLWVMSGVVRAQLLGNAVRIGPTQHPEVHREVVALSAELGIEPPQVFVMSGSGLLNAFALKFLGRGGSHILLMSELVDLFLERDRPEELRTVIAHELAHHALGHVEPKMVLLRLPSQFFPFLHQAYSRSCELSCDRVALALVGKADPVRRALLSLATGSRALSSATSAESFVQQGKDGGGFFNFLATIYSTHPLLTARVEAVTARAAELGVP